MNIRRASLNDAPAIAKIYEHYVKNTLISFETQIVSVAEMSKRIAEKLQNHNWLVLLEQETIAGYAYYGTFRARDAYHHTAESSIYLSPEFMGQGLGKVLYNALIDSAKAKAYRELIGVIALPNPSSVALHEKLGFKEVGVLKNAGQKFGTFIDVGLWQLSLS